MDQIFQILWQILVIIIGIFALVISLWFLVFVPWGFYKYLTESPEEKRARELESAIERTEKAMKEAESISDREDGFFGDKESQVRNAERAASLRETLERLKQSK